jgi:hypothetical protein
MRGLLVMRIPYQHAPEVSIVRTDTCFLLCSVARPTGWDAGGDGLGAGRASRRFAARIG